MPQSTAASPKLTLMRKVLAKARPVLVRALGELARAQVAPARTTELVARLETELLQLLQQELAATKDPIMPADATPLEVGNVWMVMPIDSVRNAARALPWCGVGLLWLKNGRPLAAALLLGDMDEPMLAAAGEGVSDASGRCRVGGRNMLKDALVLLPVNSGDTAKLTLLQLADQVPFHTRKTSSPLYDLWLVASGRVDAAVCTRLRPMEHAMFELVMRECGGSVAHAGDALLAGTNKCVAELADAIASC